MRLRKQPLQPFWCLLGGLFWSCKIDAKYTILEYIGDSGTPYQTMYSVIPQIPVDASVNWIFALGFCTDQKPAGTVAKAPGLSTVCLSASFTVILLQLHTCS